MTSLGKGARIPKTHPLIEAIGAVDELNSLLGVLAAEMKGGLRARIRTIQNDLFDVGADLSVPSGHRGGCLRILTQDSLRLERLLERLNRGLKPLSSFTLPGGSRPAALSHLARAVCRRAERRVWSLAGRGRVNPEVARYLNRLSDCLFILARALNRGKGGDTPWVPGASRRRTH